MTSILFVRHGAHDLLGHILTGRTHPVHLNAEGRRQAEWLAERMAEYSVAALYSSPLDRCLETAEPISRRLEMPVRTTDALNEVDFGSWSGLTFSQLAALPEWCAFNAFRSLNAPPGGESLAALQARLLTFSGELLRLHPGGCVVVVSHADVIKAALAWMLGVPADLFDRIEISPGSLSQANLCNDAPPRVVLLNETLWG